MALFEMWVAGLITADELRAMTDIDQLVEDAEDG
jgi:hypothetical protein